MEPFPDSTRRFSNRVADYVRSRPRYPYAMVELLIRETGLRPNHVIADIGSGTGFSAEPFLRSGNVVIGVEPNGEMREAAERLLAPYPSFRSVAGTAEATGLEEASADYVVAGQAFHWFDTQSCRREFLRVLRPPGWVVLFWNTRLTGPSAFLWEYESLLARYGTDYSQVRGRTARLVAPGRSAGGGSDLREFFGGEVERRVLPNAQEFDLEGLKSRLRSTSYVPADGDRAYGPMMEALERVFVEHQVDGRVTMDYDLEVHFGRLAREGNAAG